MIDADSNVLLEKIDNILNKVTDIQTELQKHTEKINNQDVKIALLEEQIKQLSSVNNKMWVFISAIASGVALALIKSFMGV